MAATVADDADVSIDAPIVASHNKYLEEQTTAIRSRTIPWEVCSVGNKPPLGKC